MTWVPNWRELAEHVAVDALADGGEQDHRRDADRDARQPSSCACAAQPRCARQKRTASAGFIAVQRVSMGRIVVVTAPQRRASAGDRVELRRAPRRQDAEEHSSRL